QPLVGIEASICSFGGKLGRVERILEDVWVLVAADPAQGIQLKGTLSHICKKRRKLERPDVQHNPDIAQLLLHDCGHQARPFIRGRLYREVKAHSVDWSVSRFIQQLVGPRRIVVVVRNLVSVGPALHWKNTGRRLSEPAPQIVKYGSPVDSIRQCLPDSHILQNRIADVEGHIAQYGSRAAQHFQLGVALERQHCVSRHRIDRSIRAPFTQFKSPGCRIRNDDKANSWQSRLRAPIAVVSLDNHILVLFGAYKAERPRSDWLPRDLLTTAKWHNA